MVLCIVPPKFRPIAEILKALEWYRRPSNLVQTYHGKFYSSTERAKLAEHGHFK